MSVGRGGAGAHPVVSVLLLHGVWVEESDDAAGLRLPVLFVDVPEQQQGHKHLQVVEVAQLPDAECFALQGGSRQGGSTHTHTHTVS